MAHTKDGFYKSFNGQTGNNDNVLLAGGGHLKFNENKESNTLVKRTSDGSINVHTTDTDKVFVREVPELNKTSIRKIFATNTSNEICAVSYDQFFSSFRNDNKSLVLNIGNMERRVVVDFAQNAAYAQVAQQLNSRIITITNLASNYTPIPSGNICGTTSILSQSNNFDGTSDIFFYIGDQANNSGVNHRHYLSNILQKVKLSDSLYQFNFLDYDPSNNFDIHINYQNAIGNNSSNLISQYVFRDGQKGYSQIQAKGFVKQNSSDNYVLLGGGGAKHIAEFNINLVTQTVTTASDTSCRPLILGYSSSSASPRTFSTVTNTVYASHLIYVNPSTGLLTIGNKTNTLLGINTTSYLIGNVTKGLHLLLNNGSGNGVNDGYINAITFGNTDTAVYAGIYVQSSNSYGTRMIFGTTNSYANGSYGRMILDSNGNLAIGTMSPSYKLHVNGGNAGIINTAANTSTALLTIQNNLSGTSQRALDILIPNQTTTSFSSLIIFGVAHSTNNQGTITFGYRGSGSVSNFLAFGFYSNDNILSVVASKKVGINTVTPSEALDVNGNVRIQGNNEYIGTSAGSQCHLQYDNTNKCINFIFD